MVVRIRLGIDECHKDVTDTLGGLQTLVEVSQTTWEDERPTNSSLDELAIVARVVDAATL